MKTLLILISVATHQVAGSPVEKVVDLLKELQANLENDQKVEQEMFDKYACWCEETTAKKAFLIKKAREKIQAMSTTILQLKGIVAVRTAELAELAKRIAENEETAKSATAVRQKGNGEFMTEKVELEEATDALERAIGVLSGAGAKKSLLQGGDASGEAARQRAAASVRSLVHLLPARTSLTPKQLSAIESFAEFEPVPADASAAASQQSATIQGILKDMYDTFAGDLQKQTAAEGAAQRKYEDFMAELAEQMRHMKKQVEEKEREKAEASVQLAEAMQILDDMQKQMDADIEFFDSTKAGCEAKHEEWMDRSKARKEEIEGIEKALEILTSDDAKELFGKAIKPGKETMLLQVSKELSSRAPAMKAYNALKVQAQKAKSLRLAALAATVRTVGVGHFDKVIKEIDKLIQTLKDEEKEDINQRDWCKDEYQQNELKQAKLKWKIESNEAMITKLEKRIEKLTEAITQTVEEIEATKKEIKEMEDVRKEENADFVQAKKDDEACIKLLHEAIDVLSEYYKNNKIEMGPIQGSVKLVQEKEEPPDATFSKKGSRKNESKGIISILTMLIEDLEDEIQNGIKNEVATQGEYEKNLDAAHNLVEKLEEEKDSLEEDKADTSTKKDDEEAKLSENKEDFKSAEEYFKKDLEPDCEWMFNAFEERVEKRKAEMEGLVKAKEYLSGAAPPAMLETSKISADTADDNRFDQISFELLRR